MRALVASGILAAAAFVAACTLTTDLGGLSDGAATIDDEGGTKPEASAPDAPDAPSDASAVDPYVAEVLADGPLAYYRFEDATDTNFAKDEVGAHPANVTQKGVTFGGAGVRGRGALFDGNARLDIGDAFDFAGKQPFALEVWVRTTTSQLGGELFHKRDESVPNDFKGYILYQGGDGTPHFEGWGVDLSARSDDPLPASFAHVVLSVSYATGKGNATLYVNAQPANHGGFDNVIDLADTPQHLVMGRTFLGVLDEAAIYGKPLSPDRILAHYRAGKP
jgi:hypothetical protein